MYDVIGLIMENNEYMACEHVSYQSRLSTSIFNHDNQLNYFLLAVRLNETHPRFSLILLYR